MNTNAPFQPVRARTPSLVESTQRYDELSSSGVESDWILFSPLEEENRDLLSSNVDVLSSNAEEVEEGEEDEDSDDDSLIDTLGSANPSLNLPPELDAVEDSYLTTRIEQWRKEQARELINTLRRNSDPSSDLLASWGVEDALHGEPTQEPEPHLHKSKRFYGDDLMRHYEEWEVKKIKKVARQLSTSLVREPKANPVTLADIARRLRKERSAILVHLSRSANRYFSQYSTGRQPFWRQDMSSAHSSLSISTNSIMFSLA